MKIILFVLLFGGILVAATCKGNKVGEKEQVDLAKIEELHRIDVKASMAQDFETLKSLWTEDAVKLAPGGRGVIGTESIFADMEKYKEAQKNLEILDYIHDWQEVRLLGDWAFEWGYFYGKARDKTSGDEFEEGMKLLRILQKQEDGSWKVARVMWNSLEEDGDSD